MLYEEFLATLEKEDNDGTKIAYGSVNILYETNRYKDMSTVYEALKRRYENEFAWIDEPKHCWVKGEVPIVSNCKTEISTVEARNVINKEFGFNRKKFKLLEKLFMRHPIGITFGLWCVELNMLCVMLICTW